jgi:pimeloyl-ACP methyl ester carboxylesterase
VVVEAIALQAIAEAKLAFESGDLRSRLARHHADADGAFWQWNDVWLSGGPDSFGSSFDIRKECSRITAPLLLIQGADDAYGTMRQLDEIALAAPHAVQVRLQSCGHSPHRDQPQLALTAVAGFLDGVS